MILVDSSVWIDYFRGTRSPQADFLHQMLGKAGLAVGDLILTEVLQGIRSEREFARVHRTLGAFPVLELVGRDIAVKAAKSLRFLRSKGITVRKTIDSLIATRCIEDEMSLLHSDRDFDPFAAHLGLKVAFLEI